MGVFITGGEVGTGKSAMRQSGTVRAAPEGNGAGLDAAGGYGSFQIVDHEGDTVNDFLHASVILDNIQMDSLLAVGFLKIRRQAAHQGFTPGEEFCIMIADDQVQAGVLTGALEAHNMKEAFTVFGILRFFPGG